MSRLTPFRLLLLLSLCALCALAVNLLSAQDTQCGDVDAIGFPVDTATYQIAQGFGAPSPRHNGRYHTGEDWFGGVQALGQPVYAIARGRVTYSSPNAWGRDGGVVIIEHTMPDGTTAYSMYGHMMERSDITFPARFTCVEMGTIVGAIGDIRPAPHLHFEIRTSGADIPGAGYEWEDPRTLDYREPSAFITDWQAYLGEASLWHVEFADDPLAPPLLLDDSSLLTLNGSFLRRVLPDGRILWRNTLTQPAVAIVGYEGAPLLVYADGTMQRIDYDGNAGESWVVDSRFDSPPIAAPNAYIFHTPDNALVAIDRRWRDVLWRLDDVPPFVRASASDTLITLLTADLTLLTLTTDGVFVDSAHLREAADFAPTASGMLIYTRGGLWLENTGGNWTLAFADVPHGTQSRALSVNGTTMFLFDGSTLYASEDQQILWQRALPAASGVSRLSTLENALLLLSTGGTIAVAAAADGTVCASLRLWRDRDSALLWHNLGSDGVLRVMIGRRLLGIDWTSLNRCLA
ncbi:MAG: peptidoglycan DD-metalloendopeptidase family protein [Anaerolineae bacterium]